MNDYNQAWAFCAALAGDPTTAVFDFRAIHDVQKDIPAIPMRGTLPDTWSSILHYNAQGYGIFVTPAAMDGVGRTLDNVWYLRANYIDLDNLSAEQNYLRASAAQPAPSFAVSSSPGKYHVYWVVTPYQGNKRFELLQRKLRQIYDGDKTIIDPTRVMRLPGTLHQKNPAAPHLVTCHALAGYGLPCTVEALEAATASVVIVDGGEGTRHELGDPELAAPSLEWVQRALDLSDPNRLTRGEWIAITSAVKQSGWSLTDEQTLFGMWSAWCAKYDKNDLGENLKQWNSLRSTELGWKSLVNRVPSLKGLVQFGGVDRQAQLAAQQQPGTTAPATPGAPAMPDLTQPPPLDCSGAVLTHYEQQQYFKGCVFVSNLGLIMTDKARFLNVTQFNATYGGKVFIIDEQGKTTNEAWAAATRSTLWTIPKVDHIRFLPSLKQGETVTDGLGRAGVNTYRPAQIERLAGDASPFLNHIAALLPDPGDQKMLLDYLAHVAKYPGYKIPWAPVIQSAEGAGKGVLKLVMAHVMGRPYVHFPNAKELAESGAKFNGWMRNKLFILADEIKVDDRRDMIEILKPMISEELIEVQAKGFDQELEDNWANWLFFTNWRDAIPVDKNARRFAISYSALQTAQDMLDRGMDETYFKALYNWLKGEAGYQNGAAIVAEYLLNYPIERGAVPMRAPRTSSTDEAVRLSRGPVERMIAEAADDNVPGFRGGWVSNISITNRLKETGVMSRGISASTLETILSNMGYVACGRSPRCYFALDKEIRPQLFKLGAVGDVAEYGPLQGW